MGDATVESTVTVREVNLLETCACGSRSATDAGRINRIKVLRCNDCGLVRQMICFGYDELADFYRNKYFNGAYQHSYEHDLAVANIRLDAYGIAAGSDLLDVGCGNCAFINAARLRGINATGQDVAVQSDSEYTYVGELLDIAFPTDHFDVVTVHDVLEHVVDPLATLKEIRRILRRPGKLILDFPRFWVPEGKHHWKRVEHLWMFTEEQLIEFVRRAGFNVVALEHPIPSKIVVEAEPLPEKRPQILVPAGIGDSYWVLTKLPGFLKHHGLGMPDVWVQDAGGPKRTQPYLRNVPFINAPGYKAMSDRDPIFHEAYMQDRRTVFPGAVGMDYFIAYNGVLRWGRNLEEVDPQYGCEWYPKVHVSKEAQKMRERMAGPGRYLLTFWAEAGMYRRWLAEFTEDQIVETLQRIQKELDLRIVVMGAPWDRGQVGMDIAKRNESFTNLIGSTSFDQMLGCVLGATAVLGFPAGNTMLGTQMGIPTVLLWNQYFHKGFWKYSCPPDSNYAALDTRDLTPDAVVNAVRERIAAR